MTCRYCQRPITYVKAHRSWSDGMYMTCTQGVGNIQRLHTPKIRDKVIVDLVEILNDL